MQQPRADTRLLQPSAEYEPETRLPGVRQLLMPHAYVASSVPHLNFPEESGPISMAAKMVPLGVSPPALNRPSDANFNTLPSDQCGSANFSDRSVKPLSINARFHEDRNGPHLFQISKGQPSEPSPLQEAASSPRLHLHSSAHLCQSLYQSSGNSYTNSSAGVGTIDRPYPTSYEFDRHPRGPGRERPWHETPSHRDWGTTKAGKPRKRLPQACLSCRQKKIRCRLMPNSEKCTQCIKSAISCMFEGACVFGKPSAPLRR